ncbi:alpha/beta hydrolase [Acidomonas methanolica]|uniref:alpha/beta hydrolase n=1 Tax=Acidomonas methanolica TaxID=437 RepID=UPI00211A26D4|nr:alpha/beta fold hydrolase [Acidomonas methanolica]MCQ9154321.1 alpha/beta fold hydrolase [Acidomonas methanolica]
MIGPNPPLSKRTRSFLRLVSAVLPLLAACTRAPTAPPTPKPGEDALIPPALTLTLSDGAHIPVRVWPARASSGPEPRAVILALHGFGDSRDAWEWIAPSLARAGFAVYAPDQRGFGAAPDRGGWAGTRRMVQDAREEAAWLHARFPALPLYLAGESMGGAIALRVIETPGAPPLAGTILLAPAIWRFDSATRATLALMDGLAPHWRFDARNSPVHVVPTDNIAALRRLYFDPLTLHGAELHSLRGLVDLMAAAFADAPHARPPILAVYGDADQLVPPAATAAFWRALPPQARRDLIRGGHHLLFRDRDGARVTRDVIAWIDHPDTLLPSGGDAAAAAWMASRP